MGSGADFRPEQSPEMGSGADFHQEESPEMGSVLFPARLGPGEGCITQED